MLLADPSRGGGGGGLNDNCLWGGALLDDTENGCEGDYVVSKPLVLHVRFCEN